MALKAKKLLMAGAKWTPWQSPLMTGFGTFGGADYGVAASGVSSSFPAYVGWKAFAGESSVDAYIMTAPNWVTFYSPKEIKISNITIRLFTTVTDAIGVNNRIEVSNDNSTWKIVYENTGNAGWSSLRTIPLNLDKGYKYIRFYQKYSAHTWGTKLQGVKIYGEIKG